LGYPWAPLLFAAVAGWFLYNTVVEDPRSAAIGIGLLALGLPFYYRWKPR
jgi:APA family basic amino acid/polyamine antiporter